MCIGMIYDAGIWRFIFELYRDHVKRWDTIIWPEEMLLTFDYTLWAL